MGNISIHVENLSKAYQLGQFSTGTISRDIERWWITKIKKREDPFLKIGETNDRLTKGESKIVWSLKDIDFEVNQGDAVGIIGRNGAGKSTLLKVLSRVTTPTTGSSKIKGRIASLLEVGTGFHPELTGRENIYLNGAILGMRKREIKRRFEEIVAFAGVERYIDTPVKRYSSGMYVRLAFAVAAHLESEILIIDEVLAVGDAEFQKKCLGKMGDISKGEGRTILFVSHNMASVQKLCNRGILLKNGQTEYVGSIEETVKLYTAIDTSEEQNDIKLDNYPERGGNGAIRFVSFQIMNQQDQLKNEFSIGDAVVMKLTVKNKSKENRSELAIQIKTAEGMPVFHMMTRDSNFEVFHVKEEEVFRIEMPDMRLYPGVYTISISCTNLTGHEIFDQVEDFTTFRILDGGTYTTRSLPRAAGLFFMNPKWTQV